MGKCDSIVDSSTHKNQEDVIYKSLPEKNVPNENFSDNFLQATTKIFTKGSASLGPIVLLTSKVNIIHKYFFQNSFYRGSRLQMCFKIGVPTQVFSCEYFEIFKNNFLIEYLWCLPLFLRFLWYDQWGCLAVHHPNAFKYNVVWLTALFERHFFKRKRFNQLLPKLCFLRGSLGITEIDVTPDV